MLRILISYFGLTIVLLGVVFAYYLGALNSEVAISNSEYLILASFTLSGLAFFCCRLLRSWIGDVFVIIGGLLLVYAIGALYFRVMMGVNFGVYS